MARIARTHYPGFIFGLPLARAEIPVFNYHDVEPQGLDADLEFLRRNGYRTLGLEEFLAARERKSSPGRAVLLTFDDARRSFIEVALPILRDHRAHAALFAPSYWMSGPAERRAAGRELFMSWDELRMAAQSGWVDVQSHAHRHALVHTSGEVVDFAHPAALAAFDIYDWPMRSGPAGEEQLGFPPPGTPVYRAEPLLSVDRRYLEPAELTAACQRFAREQGDASFFAQRDWRVRLQDFHARQAAVLPAGRVLPEAQFRRLVASEFERSREEFQAELGYGPTALAFPWRLGSALALELAAHFGIRAAFGVALDFGAERRASAPLPVYGRLKCDWLRFLPGAGRASVLGAIGRKLVQFSRTQHLAH